RPRVGTHGLAGALGDPRPLAGAAAQVIELGAPNDAAPDHLDRGDPGRIERKDALDALAVGDLAQRKARIDVGIAARNAQPLEGLDPLAFAFDNANHDPQRVARLEFRHRPEGRELFHLLAVQLFEEIHRFTFRTLRGSVPRD